MGIIPSRNLEAQRREENGVVYFDRGTLEGKNGRNDKTSPAGERLCLSERI